MTAVGGVDGGGTGTRAVVLDGDGREVGAGEGPPGLVEPGGVGAAAEAVEEAVRAAADAAGIALPLSALWCGLAGAGRPEERRRVEEALAGRGLSRWIRVGTDVEASFRDAFGPDRAGVLVVAGTGSIVRGRTADGESVRVGGWGELLGDEGSGYRVGLEGLRAVLRAHDGRGPVTGLRAPLLAAAGAAHPEDLVAFAARSSKAEIGALAAEVVRIAEAGDGPARRIVDEAVRELVVQAEAALDRVAGEGGAAPIVLAGGLLAPGRALGRRLEAALRDGGRRVERRAVRAERAAAGLALEAARSETR